MIRKTIPKGKREKESTVNIQCIIIMQIIQHKKFKNSLSHSLLLPSFKYGLDFIEERLPAQ